MHPSVNVCDVIFLLLFLHCFIHSISGYDLTIVHNNDIHAHFEQTNVFAGACSEEQANNGECYGGEARKVTVIREARTNFSNTVVLDAGDRFVGTLWFTHYKGAAAANFLNLAEYDAMSLGNHEFDLGVDGLVPFLDNLSVPVVDANIHVDVSQEPSLQGKIQNSLVIERGGEMIGIVGYITTDTSFISSPGPSVSFLDEVEAVRTEVEKLKSDGVNIIIGLSHSGYAKDKIVAAEVADIDIIVGGHSHTFLYSGDQPSTEEIEGPYPTVVLGPTGKNVLIVQAYAYGKFTGILHVNFDVNLDVQSWSGNPILLDNTITQDSDRYPVLYFVEYKLKLNPGCPFLFQKARAAPNKRGYLFDNAPIRHNNLDPDTLAVIAQLAEPLEETKNIIVGSTAVILEGDRTQCRLRECNTGNLLTDAMVWYHIDNKPSNDSWALAAIALVNAGGIRATTSIGPISLAQVFMIQPFGNTIEMITLKGVHLREAFEYSVSNINTDDPSGRFLHVSGIRVQYDVSRDPGTRVVSLEVRCLRCEVPTYSPVEDEEIYNILTYSFIIGGGDGYAMIKNNIIDKTDLNSPDADVLSAYLTARPMIFPEAEGRIQFVTTSPPTTTPSPPTTTSSPVPQRSPPVPPATHPVVVYRCTEPKRQSTNYMKLFMLFALMAYH